LSESATSGLRSRAETSTTPAGAEVTIVAFEGDLDLASVAGFEEAVDGAADAPSVVIDLSGVRFIDSSGIHRVVRVAAARAERGLHLALVVLPSSAVDRVLEISGLRAELDPKADRASALAALDARGRSETGADR
jgi:anti-sigma B factor antagonist